MQIPGIDVDALLATPAKPLWREPSLSKKRRPPRRVCVGCSQIFYGYKDACSACMKEQRLDSKAAADIIRQRRGRNPVAIEAAMSRAKYNEFPEGY